MKNVEKIVETLNEKYKIKIKIVYPKIEDTKELETRKLLKLGKNFFQRQILQKKF